MQRNDITDNVKELTENQALFYTTQKLAWDLVFYFEFKVFFLASQKFVYGATVNSYLYV